MSPSISFAGRGGSQSVAEAIAAVVAARPETHLMPTHVQGSTSSIALLPTGVPAIERPQYVGFGSSTPRPAVVWSWAQVISPTTGASDEAFHRLVDLKVATAAVAMHLDGPWRTGLFSQLDDLLDEDGWHLGDTLPTAASFRTFLRLVVVLGRPPRPSLGCTDSGNIVASWRRADDRLTIECRANDDLRWVLSRRIAGESESAGGICKLTNLKSRLAPYEPEVWFVADDKHPRS